MTAVKFHFKKIFTLVDMPKGPAVSYSFSRFIFRYDPAEGGFALTVLDFLRINL